MKKLILATAVALSAVIANAAAANWQCSASNIFDGNGTSSVKVSSGTVYVFDAASFTQKAVYDLFVAKSDLSESALVGAAITTAGSMLTGNSKFAYGEQGETYSYFIAVVSDDVEGSIYLSTSTSVKANTSTTAKTIAFGSMIANGNDSKALPTSGFTAAGAWASAVPEPTSGLLVMLGVGLMALRRRRA